MKNDVASALTMLGLVTSTWAAGQVLTLPRVLALGVWSGIALSVKFNAPLTIGSSVILLLTRALLPWPWFIGCTSRTASPCVSRLRRTGPAAATVAGMALMTYGILWLSYGLRFAPSPAPGVALNIPKAIYWSVTEHWKAQHPEPTSDTRASIQELENAPPPIARFARWANESRALPQSFLAGLLYMFSISQTRVAFLCGQYPTRGTWWFFPFVMLVKTPLTTLAALAGAAILALCMLPARDGRAAKKLFQNGSAEGVARGNTARPGRHRPAPRGCDITSNRQVAAGLPKTWARLCLALPVLIYLGAAMASSLNLGIRHVLPVFPLLFAGVGLVMASAWDRRRVPALAGGLLVIFGLAVETGLAYPNYIPFFNAFAGGDRGGLRLLSDSNLDWGQDLPLLAEWQQDHPGVKLYLAYFGTAVPENFGIHYTKLIDGYSNQPINSPGVIAISATTLQGTYSERLVARPYWSVLWTLKPFEVLGGSIYLFHVPPTRTDRLPAGESLLD
jgi:hypothetical protein